MERHTRTALLIPLVLAATLLAPAIVSRGKAADQIRGTNQMSQTPASQSTHQALDPAVTLSTAESGAHFKEFKVQNRKSIQELETRLGADAFAVVLKINRTDKNHLRFGESLIIPDSNGDLMALAPFPLQLESAQAMAKLILVSRRVQAFGVYESGRLVRWGPTSTGKRSTPTPAGLYFTNWKARETRSSVNQSWVLPWCFNLDNFSGVSLHEFDLPGYPASHGCVRLLEEDAKWIYDWADQWVLSSKDKSISVFGTPVLIFGDYAYGKKPLWKLLVDDPNATAITAAEIQTALTQHMATIASRARRPADSGAEAPAVAAAGAH